MTAQLERTNEKREITPEKPILFRILGLIESKPTTAPNGGKTTEMVSLLLAVDDRKYPQFDGWQVRNRTNAWCCSGTNGGRSTGTYKFMETVFGVDGARQFDRMDLKKLLTPPSEGEKPRMQTPEQLQALWGQYVVGWMKPAEPDDLGRWWQNPKEFKHPDELEWDVESRRMDQETMRKFIGLPKPNKPAPVQETKPADPPAPEPPKEDPLEVVVEKLRDYVGKQNGYGTLAKAFLILKGKDRIGALDDQAQRHLLALMQIREFWNKGEPYSALVESTLKTRNAELPKLGPEDAIFLLVTLVNTAAGNVRF